MIDAGSYPPFSLAFELKIDWSLRTLPKTLERGSRTNDRRICRCNRAGSSSFSNAEYNIAVQLTCFLGCFTLWSHNVHEPVHVNGLCS